MEEWDVFINTELMPFLHLTPLPSTSLSTRFNNQTTSTPSPSSSASSASTCRFKPQAKRLELILPFDNLSRENLLSERVRELQMEKGQKLVGAGWQWRRVQYLVGQFTSKRSPIFINFYLLIRAHTHTHSLSLSFLFFFFCR